MWVKIDDYLMQIIKGFLNDNDVYSLYATDYTKNSMMTPVQGVWCPPELADRILKIEMWDAAGALAQTMEPGEYWFLRNCRMKQSQGGYLEGTMQLAEKVVRLEASEAEHNPHFAALLQCVAVKGDIHFVLSLTLIGEKASGNKGITNKIRDSNINSFKTFKRVNSDF